MLIEVSKILWIRAMSLLHQPKVSQQLPDQYHKCHIFSYIFVFMDYSSV